jgi:hypothetical protein
LYQGQCCDQYFRRFFFKIFFWCIKKNPATLLATYHFDIHGVAGAQRQRVLDARPVRLLVLGHARRVLGQALRVDEAVELVAERRQRDRDVLGVAGHADVFDDIWNAAKKVL